MKLWALSPVLVILLLPLVTAECETKMDFDSKASRNADGTYVGKSVRLESSCFDDGDCFACSSNDEVQLVRTNDEITIKASGPSLTFTPCKQGSDIELYTLKGKSESVVDGNYRNFTITDCNNGAFPGSGSGTIEGNTIKVTFSCIMDDHGSKAEWSDVALTKQ